MAVNLGGRSRTFAEINVTPLADVMIVLLVIAMADELLPRLRVLLSEHGDGALVVVKAEQGLPFAIVRDVLRLCREAGAEELILAARSPTPL